MIELLKGKKTQMAAALQGLVLLGAAVGFKVDQAAAMAFFDDAWGWVVAGIVGFTGLISYFRGLSKKEK